MDITALAIGLKQIQLSQAVGTSVLKLALDNAEINGQMLTQIMQPVDSGLGNAVDPNLGKLIDITA